MPFQDPRPSAAAAANFASLAGKRVWRKRAAELVGRAAARSLEGRAARARHALELMLARAAEAPPEAPTLAERRALAFAEEAVRLAASLPAPARARLRARIEAALSGDETLIPLFHLLRTALLQRARGYEVAFTGLTDATPWDLTIRSGDTVAEIVCETVSAEDGRALHRGAWCRLVDRVNPELQTWLAAHPGRYVLKITLPEGLSGPEGLPALQRRILDMLAAEKRADQSADAILKLDPLVLGAAQAGAALPAELRAQFGPEAHLAVTTAPGGGGVFVMAARAGRENAISEALARRAAAVAPVRLSGERPGILALFLDEVERGEWRALRESLEIEGAVRRFLTGAAARPVVAVTCASRMELFGLAPPDAAPAGELRFRNPRHRLATRPDLQAAIAPTL
ncbi:MAG: hypothetical protein RMK90_01560 [Acetobacteraceae bacterium]|nr:hypothetical protein [Acetobacteraceae bacterium]